MVSSSGCMLNPVLASLREQATWFDDGFRPQSLWIACRDVIMDRVLQRVQRIEPVFVLREPGWANPNDEAGWRVSLEEAVEELGVRDIFLCGHSACSQLPTEDRVYPQGEGPRGTASLLQRVGHQQAMNERSQQHLLSKIRMVEQSPALAGAIDRQELSVHGMFYRVESGLFTHFNRSSQEFEVVDMPSSNQNTTTPHSDGG